MNTMDPVGKLLGDTWALYKQKGAVLTQIFILPAVLIAMVQLLALRNTPAAWALLPFMNLVVVIVSIVASIALVAAIGRGTNFEASYKVGFSLFWSAVLLAIIHTLTILGGSVLFIIPGIIFSVWFMFVNYSLVLENKRGIAAMLQSKAYVKGYWWAVVGRILAMAIIIVGVIIILYAPTVVIAGHMVGAIVYAVLILIIAPVSVCYIYKVYENLMRLKPNIAELAAKESRALVTTFMVIGIIGIIVLMALAGAAVVFIAQQMMQKGNMQQGGPLLPPNIGTTPLNPLTPPHIGTSSAPILH